MIPARPLTCRTDARRQLLRVTSVLPLLFHVGVLAAAPVVDGSKYSPDCKVRISRQEDRLSVSWPLSAAGDAFGRMTIRLAGQRPLIAEMGVSDKPQGAFAALVKDADPTVIVTVGSREVPPGKPPHQTWEVFFDNPHRRPHESFASSTTIDAVRYRSDHDRAQVTIEGVAVGGFRGRWEFSFYAGCPLLRVDAVATTDEDRRAILYDAGLVCQTPSWRRFAWTDTEGQFQSTPADGKEGETPMAVRHRAIAIDGDLGGDLNGDGEGDSGATGAIACFPPPHQYQFPRDYTDNLKFVWRGRRKLAARDGYGFGVRQNKDGGGNFVPWFNAPPQTLQRLGVFYLLSRGTAEQALAESLRYTHGDRFPELPGFQTMTSHWHMAIAVAAMQRQGKDKSEPPTPDFVKMFKEMNVNLVHLAEFHGDGHQQDPGPLRLPEMAAMFQECRRWSDDRLLLLPGEEVNTFLGLPQEGKHPGHWMSLFPRPVYWTMQRQPDQPFKERHPEYGEVYHVGSRGDMIRLIREQNALVWAAHPRIKASSWTPDIFRHEDFFLADYWLGGAWKAMPADLSREKLGERALDLLSDMANWGQKKYVLGEVDVFKIDHTHELYAHMNVNYLELDRLPRFDDGWATVLDTLRQGRFFVTTGEVLIPSFTVGGKSSGENAPLSGDLKLQARLRWTFPLAFAEVVSGDGQNVFRERIDLGDTGAFGERQLELSPRLSGRRWVRLEVWDIAANGAFTQPVWLTD